MKVSSIILGTFLLAILSLEGRAESLRPQESSVNATGTTGTAAPTLKLTNAKSHADGSIEFQVDSTEQFKVLIESSTDLANWTSEGLRDPHAALVFTRSSERGAHRFYRAADFTLRVQGTVRDIQTDLPVEQAKVTLSDLFWETEDIVAQTDAQGVFRVVVSREYPVRKITVEKTGYDVLTTEPLIYSDTSNFQVPLWLAPPGYRPANDDFQNRIAIEGTNVVIRARTLLPRLNQDTSWIFCSMITVNPIAEISGGPGQLPPTVPSGLKRTSLRCGVDLGWPYTPAKRFKS